MAERAPAVRRLVARWTPGLAVGASWAFALWFFDHGPEGLFNRAVNDAIVRVLSGFPWAQEIAHRAFEAGGWAMSMAFLLTLLPATLAVPLGFTARMVARARVRAGHADPLERARTWLGARRWRGAVALAAFPAATQALFLYATRHGGLHYLDWSWLYFVGSALVAGVAQVWAVRAGLRSLLAPVIDGELDAPRALDPDELHFDAVAVTREAKAAVGALAALSLGVAAWVATRPIDDLFRDPRVFAIIASYVAVAVGGASAFRRASRISVGVDGIYVGGSSRARFFAYRDLDEARARGGDIELVRRGRVVLRLQPHGEDATRRDAILARIHEGLARVKDVERDAAANFVTSRAADKVVDSMRGAGDYRMPSVSRDALWALVEGQSVDARTRTAAAEALARGASGEESRERLRVAAAHCADPRVRVALETIADDESADPDQPEAGARLRHIQAP